MFEDNSVVAMARSLGKALQQEQTFVEYYEAQALNDEDAMLQAMIDDFNHTRTMLDVEMSKEDKDLTAIEVYSNQLDQLYQAIMQNDNMVNYNEKRDNFDLLMTLINKIIMAAMNGKDPYAVTEAECNGSCEGCTGCG